MASVEERFSALAKRSEDLRNDLETLAVLVKRDPPAALNKMRYVTEKILHQLCRDRGVDWGKGEPTLERMIGPLVAQREIPRNVSLHIRTVQTNASPGSHFQESALDEAHVQVTQIALAQVLEWYVSVREPEASEPLGGEPDGPDSSRPRGDEARPAASAHAPGPATSGRTLLVGGVAVLAVAAVGVSLALREPSPAPAASGSIRADHSTPPGSALPPATPPPGGGGGPPPTAGATTPSGPRGPLVFPCSALLEPSEPGAAGAPPPFAPCSAQTTAWCNQAGKRIACCGAGLVAGSAGDDGICGCPPGGTTSEPVPGCSAADANGTRDWKASLSTAMNGLKKALSGCYRQSLVDGGRMEGTLKFKLMLTPHGDVFRARLHSSSFGGVDTQRCALDAIRLLRTAPPPKGHANIVYPVKLKVGE